MGFKRGNTPWNKGKNTSEDTIKKISKSLTGKSLGIGKTKEVEEERKRKISATMKLKKLGGYRKGSGRGKQGYYKGYWCDSSWELAWVIYNLDHNIVFEKNWERFYYEYNNETHYYIPDFKKDGIYIEIKGFLDEKAKHKIKVFPHKIEVLKYKELKPILTYVESTYGKNFIKLYKEE